MSGNWRYRQFYGSDDNEGLVVIFILVAFVIAVLGAPLLLALMDLIDAGV